MSNSTTLLDTIAVNSANKESVANALFDAASPGMLWGRHASACSGLTWGYYGGNYVVGSTINAIANGTVTLTASTTNYLYANATTGAVSVNTTGFPAGSIPLYSIVTGSTTVTSYTDDRSYMPGATQGAGAVTSVGISMPGIYSVSGSPVTSAGTITVTFNTQSANTVFAGPSSGSAAAPTFRALVGADIPVFGASGSSHAPGGVPDPGSTAGSTKYLCENGTWAVPAGGGGGGGGTVTDVAAVQGIETTTGADITTSGTLRANLVPTIYTSAHTVVTGDRGQGIVMNSASAVSQALPTAGGSNFPSGWFVDFVNIGAGIMTLSVPSGASLDGVTNGTLALAQFTGTTVFTDGSNWFSLRGAAGGNDPFNYANANKPTTTGFTAVQNITTNTGTGTLTIANLSSGRGFSILALPSTNSTDPMVNYGQSVPAGTSWSVTALLLADIAFSSTYAAYGLFIADGAGKFFRMGPVGSSIAPCPGATYDKWSNFPTSPSYNSRTDFNGGASAQGTPVWMRITYNGSTFVYFTSADGETWAQRFSISSTDWIGTPATCGISLDANKSGVAHSLTCFHYVQG
ncbi:hypothetical protein [Burkholderia ubonensis]|uniref:hypothetical protein n=1 Tax=Burkholderia ubonensis TaxID=101571 RepID=UPI000B1A4EBB|nr:hypothetical protein [Burkholderia ubonensis]